MCRPTTAALATGLVLALANFLPSAAQAQIDSAGPAVTSSSSKPIGKVVAATGSVTIEHAGAVIVQANVSSEPGQAKRGDPVYLGDVVLTGDDGRVGINLSDGSSFNLSSNARMVLDHYVYEPAGKSNATLFSLAKGTFTFVAGNVAKTGDMKVDTPVATLGIRGTTPHIEISDDGSAKFSTLIEEGKSKVLKKPPAGAAPEPDRSANRRLIICRGC
ncbi:FecR domain-containing protein [Bradyrhizobium sp. IC3069]|nr:FecR family protein [Bradyrhizobium sp. IC3195]MCA1362395.1 FecR domain-containing protein [Bradyrhizobium sp. IC4059]MCA1433565.1 FecR domain-containing protein [Bradyrhizobium sp. BRP20]MCA1520029.1 FecR domain-containing protein [Bradyrhizobium sp. IC3069]MCA1544108.1 FecR domain-containing protein [Bradyrhizobium sp. NBAIM32]MCA1467664.1 FecR domain-containing protein [Bradyrhizobium sp. IC3195]